MCQKCVQEGESASTTTTTEEEEENVSRYRIDRQYVHTSLVTARHDTRLQG